MKTPHYFLAAVIMLLFCSFIQWGFFAHQQINRLAIFTLPVEMITFYKTHADIITESAVGPDKRRFFSPDEAPRHYIDIDHYGDSAFVKLPHRWKDAVARFTEDTLKAYGIVPWHINAVYYQLRNAFGRKDPKAILRLSAEIGHYIADAHVPLHTTENYNGQLTDQVGIHAFWESRLPELFSEKYNFFVGKAQYISGIQASAWDAVRSANHCVDSVLVEERKLSIKFGERKYAFETKGKQTVKVYSYAYAKAYHDLLDGMVEKQMRSSILMIGSFWYSAWVDAGQPDLNKLTDYKPSEEELKANREAYELWQKRTVVGDHDE